MAVSARDRFLADLQKATAGITYTPQGVSQLRNLATQQRGGSLSAGDKAIFDKAPIRRVVDTSQMPDPGPQASTAGVAPSVFTYPSVLPPLSPEAQRAFAERRRLATRAEEEARAQIDRQRQMAEGAAVQGRRQIAEQQAEQSRAGMAEFAGRGVARSPMFVNPFQRGVARQAQQRVGELEMGLSQTLENLGAALQQAQLERERELAQIETDIMTARSNVPGILGV